MPDDSNAFESRRVFTAGAVSRVRGCPLASRRSCRRTCFSPLRCQQRRAGARFAVVKHRPDEERDLSPALR
jgi:hypothetical protein